MRAKLPEDRQARVRAKTQEMLKDIALVEADLAEMRKLVGKTQVEVAAKMKVSQGNVSETERRSDYLLSTLREYVKALGGKLEVIATFGDRSIKLHALGE